MCGIAAFSLKPGLKKAQLDMAFLRIKTLGILNEERGEHSSGLFINGKIYKGYTDAPNKIYTKLFRDLISSNSFDVEELDSYKSTVSLVHTRKATYGNHTEENCHPFEIESIRGKNDNLYCVHNGSIENIWNLCTNHGVNHSNIHLDSKGLYTLIDKVGLSILNEYRGGAALIWNKKSESNAIYAYHGAYREKIDDKEIYEERPLYYMYTEEGLFLSSLAKHLTAISDYKYQKPEELPFNVVYKIQDGEFVEDFHHEVDRSTANLKTVSYSVSNCKTSTFYSRNADNSFNNSTRYEAPKKYYKPWQETLPLKSQQDFGIQTVFYQNGRYWYNDKNQKIPCDGQMFIKNRGVISIATDIAASSYWFFNGVMLNTEKDFEIVTGLIKTGKLSLFSANANFAFFLSKYSRYPVCNLENQGSTLSDCYRCAWYINTKRNTISFTPKFSGRHYIIKDGFLIEIKSSNKEDKKTIIDAKENTLLPTVRSNFDKLFFSEVEMMKAISNAEMQAITRFVKEECAKDAPLLQYDNNEVDYAVMSYLRTALSQKITIREVLNDTYNVLDRLLIYFEEDDSILKYEIEQENMENVKTVLVDVLSTIDDFEEQADELQAITDSDFAQEVAECIYRRVGEFKKSLTEVLVSNNCNDVVKMLNKKIIV